MGRDSKDDIEGEKDHGHGGTNDRGPLHIALLSLKLVVTLHLSEMLLKTAKAAPRLPFVPTSQYGPC
jgi:hypothetical protein